MQESLTAGNMVLQLELSDVTQLKHWLVRLLDWGLVQQSDRTPLCHVR